MPPLTAALLLACGAALPSGPASADAPRFLRTWAMADGRLASADPALAAALPDALKACRAAAAEALVDERIDAAFRRHYRHPGTPMWSYESRERERQQEDFDDAVQDAAEAARSHPDTQRARDQGQMIHSLTAACVSNALGRSLRIVYWDRRKQRIDGTLHPPLALYQGRWEAPLAVVVRQIEAFGGDAVLRANAWRALKADWDETLPSDHPARALLDRGRDAVDPPAAAASAPEGPTSPSALPACADCPPLIAVPAGGFLMGSSPFEPGRFSDEGLPRPVAVPAFMIGRTEVTRAQWKAVMGNKLPKKTGDCERDDCPVTGVSWDAAQTYIAALNARTGRRYRLPTEAEWEYAARAGTRTAYSYGDTGNLEQMRVDRRKLGPVARYAPNAWGLHDVHGSAAEWVQDCQAGVGERPDDGRAIDATPCPRRILRGGGYDDPMRSARSASRMTAPADLRHPAVGLRLAHSPP